MCIRDRSFCEGINIPDGVLRGAWHFDENMYIGEKPTDKLSLIHIWQMLDTKDRSAVRCE